MLTPKQVGMAAVCLPRGGADSSGRHDFAMTSVTYLKNSIKNNPYICVAPIKQKSKKL
ncbi:MAG: hypothetical protein V4463_11995 [Pseudomonadota bacterium]